MVSATNYKTLHTSVRGTMWRKREGVSEESWERDTKSAQLGEDRRGQGRQLVSVRGGWHGRPGRHEDGDGMAREMRRA